MSNRVDPVKILLNSQPCAKKNQGCKEVSFGEKPTFAAKIAAQNTTKTQERDRTKDHIILPKESSLERFSQAMRLNTYVSSGLMGHPESNFYEFMQLGKIPYYIGGPVLVGMYSAALNKYNLKAAQSIAASAKRVAAGVVLYYGAVALSKAVIDIPVRLFRGIDLNQKYLKINKLKAIDYKGDFTTKPELHDVYESIDFTRWDLLYGANKTTAKGINENYDKLARKFNADRSLNDSDDQMKSPIKKLITMARAWKYMLTVPFVMLALGISDNEKWESVGKSFKENFKNVSRSDLPSVQKLANLKELFQTFLRPIPGACVDLWKRNALGKGIIIASAALPVLANVLILGKTSLKSEQIVDRSKINGSNT